MDLSRRVALVQQQLDNIATDIDQPHGECAAALQQIGDAVDAARAGLTDVRDAALRRRREASRAKDAAIAKAGAQ